MNDNPQIKQVRTIATVIFGGVQEQLSFIPTYFGLKPENELLHHINIELADEASSERKSGKGGKGDCAGGCQPWRTAGESADLADGFDLTDSRQSGKECKCGDDRHDISREVIHCRHGAERGAGKECGQEIAHMGYGGVSEDALDVVLGQGEQVSNKHGGDRENRKDQIRRRTGKRADRGEVPHEKGEDSGL